MNIPFNIPYLTGKETEYVNIAINIRKAGGKSSYADKCKTFIKGKWGYREIHLTTSCSSALELCAILTGIKQGDEVIVPSYTFPSTANAFIRQGAKIIFADSRNDRPGIDEGSLESLITSKTRAVVPVHYAGVACDMEKIMETAEKYNLFVIEDAAHGMDAYYKNHALGSMGHLGCLSFHETKNLQCGEGGALIINDERFSERINNILEKGTNRVDFINGKTDHYEWTDIGSSFGISELHAAFLYAQLERADRIKEKRISLWQEYFKSLVKLQKRGFLRLPEIPLFAGHNAHIFYVTLNDPQSLINLKNYMLSFGFELAGHYTSLDRSRYWHENNAIITENLNSGRFNDCLLRLPLFNGMELTDVHLVTSAVFDFFY